MHPALLQEWIDYRKPPIKYLPMLHIFGIKRIALGEWCRCHDEAIPMGKGVTFGGLGHRSDHPSHIETRCLAGF